MQSFGEVAPAAAVVKFPRPAAEQGEHASLVSCADNPLRAGAYVPIGHGTATPSLVVYSPGDAKHTLELVCAPTTLPGSVDVPGGHGVQEV